VAYPTGSGSERLMRGAINEQSNDPTSFKFDGTSPTKGAETDTVPALHIITVIAIYVCDVSDSAGVFSLTASDGSSNANLLVNQAVGAHEAFVYNDKIVLQGGDFLKIVAGASDDFDVWYSYIDQNWT
jgi:hypothetical protein